jgi:hypothetical protein
MQALAASCEELRARTGNPPLRRTFLLVNGEALQLNGLIPVHIFAHVCELQYVYKTVIYSIRILQIINVTDYILFSNLDTLDLWDTKFRTLHGQKPLSDCIKSTSSRSPSIRYLQSTSRFIIVASDTSVSVCGYAAEKATLKSSLGILQQSNK